MKVTNIETHLLGVERPLISMIRVHTDEGITGIGDCTLFNSLNQECSRAMPYVVNHLKPLVIGQDPFDIEKIWQSMFFETFWARGGGAHFHLAIGAIEIALWDIVGKKLKTPVYNLLGGRCRKRIRVYANRWFKNCHKPKDYAKAAERVVEDGFSALKFDPLGPINDGALVEKDVIAKLKAVRDTVGDHVDILIDMHGKLGPQSAIKYCRKFEKFDPMFCEEPVAPGNIEAMAKVARNVEVPIAAGERLYTRFGFREYLERGILDIVQPDISLTGGILEVSKKIASMADTYFIPIAPHFMEGPIATAIAIQVDACTPNFLIQEMKYWENKNGYLEVSTKPGLGIEINENKFNEYLLNH